MDRGGDTEEDFKKKNYIYIYIYIYIFVKNTKKCQLSYMVLSLKKNIVKREIWYKIAIES